MVIVSAGANRNFPALTSHVQTWDRTTDHHPLSFAFTTSFCPPSPVAPPPSRFYRTLSESELKTFNTLMGPVYYWCEVHTPIFETLEIQGIQERTEKILESVAQSYTFISGQQKGRSKGIRDRQLELLLSALPPPGDPQYPERLRDVERILEGQMAASEKRKKKRLHGALVRGVRLKRTIAEALKPSNRIPLAVLDPNTGASTTCPKRGSEIFADCLHSLGGPPDFTPNERVLEAAIENLPSCPETVRESPLVPMSEVFLKSKLKEAHHGTAGGPDQCNLYLLSLCSKSLHDWLLKVVNLHLTVPMPESWQRSNVFLLYKKGPPDDPKNYRPISLLNVVYKLIASHVTATLSALCAEHGLDHPSQIGGRHNRRTSDHIWHLCALMEMGVAECAPCEGCSTPPATLSREAAAPPCRCDQSPSPPPNGRTSDAFYHLYVDFNKAFNSVPRVALKRALEAYGLPRWLIRSVFLLYTDPNDYPLFNGHTPSFHRLDRGLRQGCPMSPILLNLCLGLALCSLPYFVGLFFSFIG